MTSIRWMPRRAGLLRRVRRATVVLAMCQSHNHTRPLQDKMIRSLARPRTEISSMSTQRRVASTTTSHVLIHVHHSRRWLWVQREAIQSTTRRHQSRPSPAVKRAWINFTLAWSTNCEELSRAVRRRNQPPPGHESPTPSICHLLLDVHHQKLIENSLVHRVPKLQPWNVSSNWFRPTTRKMRMTMRVPMAMRSIRITAMTNSFLSELSATWTSILIYHDNIANRKISLSESWTDKKDFKATPRSLGVKAPWQTIEAFFMTKINKYAVLRISTA